MLASEKGFSNKNTRFLRQLFFEKRKLFLEGPIDTSYTNDETMPVIWSTSARGVIDQIIYLDDKASTPITLLIHSPGGDLNTALTIYDIMIAARSPIYTVAIGFVASAALPILAAGKHGQRFIFPRTTTMIHLGQSHAVGTRRSMRKQLDAFGRVDESYVEILSRHTGQTPEEIKKYMEEEYYMGAEETIKFGLADAVVTSLNQIFVL